MRWNCRGERWEERLEVKMRGEMEMERGEMKMERAERGRMSM